MARPPEPGVPAQFSYQAVRYFPFGVGPGASLVLTADPWSYLFAWLQRNRPKKGVRRTRFERALYYAELAAGFFAAAQDIPLPTKGTLVYYGMLNLVKCFISVRGVELEKTFEHHGLTLPHGSKFEVQVSSPPSSGLGIFHEFAKCLGTPVAVSGKFPIKEVFGHLPEIHEIAFSLGLLPWSKRKFLPIGIEFVVNQAKDRLFTEVFFEKKNEARVDTTRFLRGERAKYFKTLGEDGGKIWFRSKGRRHLTKTNWPRVYGNICVEYGDLNVVSLLTREGYRYYCDLTPGPYHHLCFSLATMFYIGTVARYRPTETRDLMGGELRPLVTEVVAILPHQFTYHIISFTTRSVCVVPHARLG